MPWAADLDGFRLPFRLAVLVFGWVWYGVIHRGIEIPLPDYFRVVCWFVMIFLVWRLRLLRW